MECHKLWYKIIIIVQVMAQVLCYFPSGKNLKVMVLFFVMVQVVHYYTLILS